MRINLRKIMAGTVLATLLAVALARASSPPASPPTEYLSGRATTLLVQIQAEAAALRPTAETLSTLAWNPQINWKSHAFYLNEVKGHINTVGKYLADLQGMQGSLASWQQQAVSRVSSYALQVAASTQAAIDKLRTDQGRLFVPDYRNHLTTIADASQDMHETVSKFVNYDKARQQFQQLQNELELAGD